MARCAVVLSADNVCINIIMAETTDLPPDDCILVDVDYIDCEIGWVYDPVVGDFVDPNPLTEEEA